MTKYVFADEAGDFEFARKQNVSRYFIVCTVAMDDCAAGPCLLELRRKLARDGHELGDYFHASEDKQLVRDSVFELIRGLDLCVDATIMEKSKAQPQTRVDTHRFYKYGWYYHFKYIAPRILAGHDEIMIAAASLGTKRDKAHFKAAINDVAQQTARVGKITAEFIPAAADPCIQIADYCAWAIQRKWERADLRSYNLIADKVVRERDLWQAGTVHYY
jgi:hypothetical protein